LGKLKGRDHLKYVGVDGTIILKWNLRERGCEGVYWIYLVQDMDRWLSLANTVMSSNCLGR
jgi:hypothetical protein